MILGLLIVFFLPGYVTLRAMRRREKAPEREGLLDTAFLSTLISVLLASWWGLILAELGRFALSSLLVPLVLYSLLMTVLAGIPSASLRGRHAERLWRLPVIRLTRDSALLAIILVVAVVLFCRPAETILGNHDAGLHMGGGIHLAQTGSFLVPDPLVANLENRAGLIADYGGLEVKFPGLMLWDAARGLTVPQFTALYEVWVAISHSIFGSEARLGVLAASVLKGALPDLSDLRLFLFVSPFFGLLSIVAVYLLGCSLWDKRAALTAAFLLTVNIAQVWYSRVSMSEVFTQLLIVSGLYAFIRFVRTWRPSLALIAGVALGEAVISRVDSVFLLLPASLLLVYLWATRAWRREYLCFFVPLFALSLHGLLHYALFSTTYVLSMLIPLWQLYAPWLAVVLGAGMVLLLVLLALRRLTAVPLAWQQRWRDRSSTLRWVLSGAILLLAGYAYFVRPRLSPDTLMYHALWRQEIPVGLGANLVKLGWYLSPLGLLLAIGGLLSAIWERQDQGKGLFLGTAMLYSALFVYNPFVTPHHLFWVRRFLPVVIPAAMLFTGRLLSELGAVGSKWRGTGPLALLRTVLTAGLLAVLGISCLASIRPIFWHIEDQGAIDQVAAFSGQFDDRSVVLFEDSDAAGWLAFPLSCIYDKTSFVPQRADLNGERVFQTIGKWLDWGWKVYYVTHQGLTTLHHEQYAFVAVGEWTIECPQFEMSFNRLPRAIDDRVLDVQVYRVMSWAASSLSYPLLIDVGDFDYGFLSRGFYLREETDTMDFRWTSGVAELSLPWQPQGDTVTLSLRLAGGRTKDMEPARVKLYVSDTQIDEFVLENGFVTRSISIPRAIAPPPLTRDGVPAVMLRLEVNSWVPAMHGGQDVRELGVALDWLKLEDGWGHDMSRPYP